MRRKRRNIEALAQNIADARLTFDGNAGQLQIADITIDGSLGYLQSSGKKTCRREAPPSQLLNDLEQPVGAAHRMDC